jgi:hypothetical protein
MHNGGEAIVKDFDRIGVGGREACGDASSQTPARPRVTLSG